MTPKEPKSTPTVAEANAAGEALYQNILDSLGDGVLVVDRHDQVVWANHTFLRAASVTLEQIQGQSLPEVLRLIAPRVENPEEFIKKALANRESSEKTVVDTLELRGEKLYYVQQTRRPLHGVKGEVLGQVYSYHDVTREKQIDQMKSEFISIASHELRTPMTSIKGSLDLLLGGFAGEISADTRELLVIAQQGCERLIRLINDILDIAKIEAGKVQLKFEPFNLLESAHRSARSIKTYADAYNVSIKVECPEPLPEILADRDRLDQVITNLLSNAVKFSPPGGVVTLSLGRRDQGIECCVADQGQGIPPDQLERVFGKFQQVEGHEGRKGGTGLGLAIVQALVQGHKGRIWVESKLGEGSRFIFQIPLPS